MQMYKKIIISEEEFNLKIPKDLQGKAIEIYIFPVEEGKDNFKTNSISNIKKISNSFY